MLSYRQRATILLHSIGWIAFLSLPVLFIAGQNAGRSVGDIIASVYYWLFLLCYALLFYTHTYVAAPLWYRKKNALYVVYVIIFLCAVLFLKPFDKLVRVARDSDPFGGRAPHERLQSFPGARLDDERPPPPMGESRPPREEAFHFDIISIILFILTLALSVAVTAAEQLRVTKERALRAETKKVEAELSFLKMQIHPHFLFNTLNNIYSLATVQDEHTAEAILKLSNILRYVVDDVSDKFVPLTKEINCITDYISLQQLRLNEKTNVQFELTGNITDKILAPMLLMTFVENAFKYGVSTHHPSAITIRIITTDLSIHFFCRNQVFNSSLAQQSTGIGLTNARQRLDYLYKDRYTLNIQNTDGTFTVDLEIAINIIRP